VAPVGERDDYVERARGNITPYLSDALETVWASATPCANMP
jgi:hypothetical protein